MGEARGRGLVQTITDAKGEKLEFKWCDTCALWKPPRASHCRICKRCFQRYDHHCPWVGTCVARGNHRFFCGFLTCIGTAGLCVPVALALAVAAQGAFDEPVTEWNVGTGTLALLGFCGACWFSSCALQGICQGLMLCLDVTTRDVVGSGNQSFLPTSCADARARCSQGPKEVRCADWRPRQH